MKLRQRSVATFTAIALLFAGTVQVLNAGQGGDADSDRDVDFHDASRFQPCFDPDVSPPRPDCTMFDFDGNGVVDLLDYAALQGTLFGPGVIPPKLTDTSLIVGDVFNAKTLKPIAGARVTAVFHPSVEGQPSLPPVALTDAAGHFEYTTVPFRGDTTFLLAIRKDGLAENLRRVEIMAGRCAAVDDAVLDVVTPPVMVMAKDGGMLTEPTGQVTLEIPPNALMQDSEIGITVLTSEDSIRDKLPPSAAFTLQIRACEPPRGLFINNFFGGEPKR